MITILQPVLSKDIKQKFYLHSPWLIKNIIANAYSIKKHFKNFGTYYKTYIEELEKSQWYSAEELVKLQLQKLRNLVSHANNYSPYYMDLAKKNKLSADSINNLDDLRNFPIINKELVRDNFIAFISKNHNHRHATVESTSGTTGKYMTFIISKQMYQKHIAYMWHHRS